MCTHIKCFSLSHLSNFFCFFCNNSKEKNNNKKHLSKKSNKKVKNIELKNKPSIKILMIGDEKDSQLIKVKEYIQEYFFNKKFSKEGNVTIYEDSDITLEITTIDFNLIHYNSQNQYNYIFSFCNEKKDNIEIIKTFKKCKYLMKKICQKFELLEECPVLIEEEDLLLINHFTKRVKEIFSLNSNKTVSESIISKTSKNSLIDINKLKEELKPLNNTLDSSYEEPYLCPISKEIMEDPVVTPYGHSFERKSIVEVINKNGLCPFTRKKLEIKDLIPNYTLKTAIENYKKQKKYN